MACGCGKARNRERFVITLPGGLKVEKTSEVAARNFAAKHPGATVSKKAAA